MKQKFTYILLCLLLAVTACTNEIGLMPDNEPSKLIVNALLSADGARNRIYLHRSGWAEATEVTDGIIRLYINGTMAETITARPATEEETGKAFYEVKSRFHTGDQVKLEAENGNKTLYAEAETTVEAPLEVKLDTVGIEINTSWGGVSRMLQIKMDLKAPQRDRCYRLDITRTYIAQVTNTETQTDSVYRIDYKDFNGSNDVALTDGQPNNNNSDGGIELFPPWTNYFSIFNDAFFKQGYYTMTITAGYPSVGYLPDYTIKNETSFIDVQLVSISAQEYQYLKAICLHADADSGSPIENPVIIPNHIKYGIGIFAIENSINHHISIK